MGRNGRIKRTRRSSRAREAQEVKDSRTKLAALLLSRPVVEQCRKAVLDSGAVTNSCILSTRVYVDLALSLGFRCAELVVEACAMNPVASAIGKGLEEHGSDRARDADALRELVERGGYVVVLGAIDEGEVLKPGHWVGHLVALLEDPTGQLHLVDVSLDQATRPKKCMLLRSTAFPVPDDFVDGVRIARLSMETPDGECLIDYQARPDEMGYLRAPDWSRRFQVHLTTKSDGSPVVTIHEHHVEES